MAEKTYFEKLKDPKWQKMRLKVLERDEWKCQICDNDQNTLAVHHRYYEKGKEPWDYPMEALITLCEECHTSERENRPACEELLLDCLRRKFMSLDIHDIALGFHGLELATSSDSFSRAYSWAIGSPDMQVEIIQKYEDYLQQKRVAHDLKHQTSHAKEMKSLAVQFEGGQIGQ